MKTKYLYIPWILIISLGFLNDLFAGDIKYRVADIPKNLLKDAKAVVRNEEIVVDIKSNGKLVQKVKYAITILNKNGEANGYFLHPYDKSMKISGIKAQLYDENGVEFKKKGGLEILDFALISGGSTYDDNRIKKIYPDQYTYPYTIEYSWEVSFTDVLQYPDWNPVNDLNVAVEKSKFTLIVSKNAVCRYYEKNLLTKVQIQNSSEGTVYTWELSNITAFADENFSPPLEDISPIVMLAPSKIDVEGYEGSIETWTGFGKWINQLNQGRDILNDDTKAKIRKITEGITDDRTKIKLLYEYMQNKTRYVNISVGIGGFQPFDAETVDRLSYGDCKALSNYMKSILEVAGISSRYTLIHAGGDNPTIYPDFPSNQFNHVILCVPMATDTVWLECTDQNNPFNYMGMFTANRLALIVEAEVATLVNTPELKPESNLESRKVDVTLDPSGGGFAFARNIFRGTTYDGYVPILMSDQADRKKMMTRKIHIPNFELDNFSIQETKAEKPFVTEKLNISLTNYCTKVGEKLMLCLNLMNKINESPFQAAVRKYPVSFKWPIYEIDTVTYDLPQGYTLEKIPAKIKLSSEFGEYSTEVSKSGSTIQYIRIFKVFKADHPIEKYDEIVTFFDKIVNADENKVMLTRVM